MNRLVAAACGLMLAGLAPARRSTEPPGTADAMVASTVAEVLRTGRHPWLRWPSFSDVAPALRDLYGGEADWLFWFAGDRPHPKRPTRVNLREPLRVVIFYDTVHVNSEGIVHFVGDIYGHDRALDQALARGYP